MNLIDNGGSSCQAYGKQTNKFSLEQGETGSGNEQQACQKKRAGEGQKKNAGQQAIHGQGGEVVKSDKAKV